MITIFESKFSAPNTFSFSIDGGEVHDAIVKGSAANDYDYAASEGGPGHLRQRPHYSERQQSQARDLLLRRIPAACRAAPLWRVQSLRARPIRQEASPGKPRATAMRAKRTRW